LFCSVYLVILLLTCIGHAVTQLVEALHYKLEGLDFDSHWCHWNYNWHNFLVHAVALA